MPAVPISQFSVSVLDRSLYHMSVTLNFICFSYGASALFRAMASSRQAFGEYWVFKSWGRQPQTQPPRYPSLTDMVGLPATRLPPTLTHIIAIDSENMQTFGVIWSHIYIQMSVDSDTIYDANYIKRVLNIPIRKCPSTKILGLEVWDLSNGRNNVNFYVVYSE
jgi:hypothetical protein